MRFVRARAIERCTVDLDSGFAKVVYEFLMFVVRILIIHYKRESFSQLTISTANKPQSTSSSLGPRS